MPTVPSSTKCRTLGCKNPRSKRNGFCVEHGGSDAATYNPAWNKKRQANTDKYNTAQWRTLRQIQLSRFPICAGCKANGVITAASVVDHVFPWTHINEQAFFINIFQSLCPTCHATKGQLERQGIFRKFGATVKDYAKEDYMSVVGWINKHGEDEI